MSFQGSFPEPRPSGASALGGRVFAPAPSLGARDGELKGRDALRVGLWLLLSSLVLAGAVVGARWTFRQLTAAPAVEAAPAPGLAGAPR